MTEKQQIGDTVMYTFKNGMKFIDKITVSHVSFHMYAAIGQTEIIDKIKFTNTEHTPVVGKPFFCLVNKGMEVEFWAYV